MNSGLLLIPIEIDYKVVLLISINHNEAGGSSFHPLEIEKLKHFVHELILNPETGKLNLLDKKLPEYLNAIEKVQIGTLLRNAADSVVKDLNPDLRNLPADKAGAIHYNKLPSKIR